MMHMAYDPSTTELFLADRVATAARAHATVHRRFTHAMLYHPSIHWFAHRRRSVIVVFSDLVALN